jgi:hypothetical protein
VSSGLKLDTSGEVRSTGADFEAGAPTHRRWSSLSPFEQGYTAPILEAVGAPFHKLAPETLALIMKDCGEWVRMFEKDAVFGGIAEKPSEGSGFWSLRQRDRLSNFPPLTITLADDGLIYLRAKL